MIFLQARSLSAALRVGTAAEELLAADNLALAGWEEDGLADRGAGGQGVGGGCHGGGWVRQGGRGGVAGAAKGRVGTGVV